MHDDERTRPDVPADEPVAEEGISEATAIPRLSTTPLPDEDLAAEMEAAALENERGGEDSPEGTRREASLKDREGS
jgi:hypothetical protein